VIDVPSLLANLAELAGDEPAGREHIEPLREGDELVGLRVDGREIRAQRIVLSAGAGTADLLHAWA
jgi:glycine/D-amino acid oxidase-like deaminating enzyme